MLGWPLTQLFSSSSTAQALNVFAGVLASLSMMLVYEFSLRVLKLLHSDLHIAAQLGAAFGTLALAFSTTLWDYSVQFTPYILITVCTGMILWRMLQWWEGADRPDSWKHFAWLGLLIGIDFSVHCTNALLAPSVLAWVIVRDAKTLLNWRVWDAGAFTMIAALSLQLLYIPISRSTLSLRNWDDTSTLKLFSCFISLDRLGGGFLVSF